MAEPSGAETIETATPEGDRPNGTDETLPLVELARGGDADAYARLVASYERQVRIYLARLIGDDVHASDLAQDVFVRAWQHLFELRDPARFRGWLFRIATNAARSWLRRQRLLSWVSLERWHAMRGDSQISGPLATVDMVDGPASFEERLADGSPLYFQFGTWGPDVPGTTSAVISPDDIGYILVPSNGCYSLTARWSTGSWTITFRGLA